MATAKHPEAVATKLNARLQYSNVYSDTNVVYDLQSNKLKESVVISRYDSSLRGYSYTLDVGKLVPVLNEDNSISFYDEHRENVVMTMPAPFMVDAAKAHNYDVAVILRGAGSAYTLQYILPQQWLAAEERVWPVVLDPVVTPATNASNVRDVGHPGKSAFAVNIGWLVIGPQSEVYESPGCEDRIVYEDVYFDIAVSGGKSQVALLGYHYDYSISLLGIGKDIIEYINTF